MIHVFLLVLISFTLVSSANAQSREAVVAFPTVGRVTVEARFTPSLPKENEALQRPVLIFRSPEGRELQRVEFAVGDNWHSELNFTVVQLPEFTDPLIIAVAVEPGGSDHHYESTVIGVVDGKIQDLLKEHPRSNVQGAFCLGRFGRNRKPGILSLNFIWKTGVHYQAHRYRCILYGWTGRTFDKAKVLETKSAHETWQDAASELGFHCRNDFVGLLLPEVR
jgi:hypothetical protein